MHILMVTDQFPPHIFGGMAQHAWHIAHQLGERHLVRVLVPWEQRAEWGDVPFDIYPILTTRFPRLDVMSILWHARSFGADVVHVCNAALSYRPVSRFYPTVTRVVGNDFLRPWCGYALPFRPLLYRLPGEAISKRLRAFETKVRKSRTIARLKQVDAVVANSEWTRGKLLEEGIPESKVCVVTGGVDISIFHPPEDKCQVRREIGLPADARVILTAANLVMKKGIDTVLQVLAKLVLKWPSLYYVVVGDGRCEDYLQEFAIELGMQDQVIFTGRKAQEELCKYYQAADIYVQISRNQRLENGYLDVETMGRTYMEAGACGLPVVAAKVGGVPSVVRHEVNGLLVDDMMDREDVAAKSARLLADEELRHRMGKAGLNLAREKFSWEQVAARFEDLMAASVACSNKSSVKDLEVKSK